MISFFSQLLGSGNYWLKLVLLGIRHFDFLLFCNNDEITCNNHGRHYKEKEKEFCEKIVLERQQDENENSVQLDSEKIARSCGLK